MAAVMMAVTHPLATLFAPTVLSQFARQLPEQGHPAAMQSNSAVQVALRETPFSRQSAHFKVPPV